MMLLSDCESSAEVASSSTSRRGSRYSARAIHKPLDLPSRKSDTPLTHHLQIAQRQFADEAVGIGLLCDLFDAATIRLIATARDVVGDGPRKQQIGLHHIADLCPKVFLVHNTDVVAIHC